MCNERHRFLTVIIILLIPLAGTRFISSPLTANDINRSDPAGVANAFLKALREDDYNGIIRLMSDTQRQEYQEMLDKDPKNFKRLFLKDKKKAGKTKQVTELRKMTTFSGKQGIAAKVKKKKKEVYIIVLSEEGKNYFYENSVTVTAALYNKLTFIQTCWSPGIK
ncbi:MAG: hypothetical protein GY940_29690 [bacterium]|nr:hypothetical protein [bacterium]